MKRHAHSGVVQRFFKFLEAHDLANGSIGAAFSGGPDSTALAICCAEASKAGKIASVIALHVNHGVRPESGSDAKASMANAAELGITCRVLKLRLPDNASEGLMRDYRYGVLAEAARELNLNGILTGHHQRDQAETMILHLARGTGTEGLAGIAPDESIPTPIGPLRVLRPFLNEAQSDLKVLVAESGLTPIIDATNFDCDKARNLVRHEVLDLLAKVNPEAVAHIARTAEIVRAEHDMIARIARAAIVGVIDAGALSGLALAPLDVAIQRRVVRIWIESSTDVELSFDRSEAIRIAAIAGTGGISIELGNGWIARQSNRRFTLLKTVIGIEEQDVDS